MAIVYAIFYEEDTGQITLAGEWMMFRLVQMLLVDYL